MMLVGVAHCETNPRYIPSGFFITSSSDKRCILCPGFDSAGSRRWSRENSVVHNPGGTAEMPREKSFRIGIGTRDTCFQILPPQKYRLYPAKSSSPPSPESATVTCCRASCE